MRDPIKVYDARWDNQEFTDAEVTRLFEATVAYGREIGVDTVVFSRDARLAAGHVMDLGVQAALRGGMRVFVRPEPISTPQGYFTTLWVSQQHRQAMGLVITASHNPAPYVGVKFTVPVVQAIGYDCGPMGGLKRVRELYHAKNGTRDARPTDDGRDARPTAEGHEPVVLDLGREYVEFSMAQAGVKPGALKGLKVVLDAFHGSAGPEIYTALLKAGATVHAMRLIPDGTFPTGSPNPTSQGKMDAAVAWCRENRYDVVIGVDGDGDRIVFGDGRGILTAGFAAVPILKAAKASHQQEPPAVLYDPKVSPLALAEWGKLGVRPVLFRNGHSQIKDYMTRIGAPAAAEESGHYYHRISMGDLTVSSENSILTILLFLGAVAGISGQQEACPTSAGRGARPTGKGLMDELWRLQDQVFTTGEFNYQFDSDATRDAAMSAVIEHCVQGGASTMTHTPEGMDLEGTVIRQGVDLRPGQVKLAEGWYSGYLRVATNEKSVVRSYFSAGDPRKGKAVEKEAREILGKKFRGRVID